MTSGGYIIDDLFTGEKREELFKDKNAVGFSYDLDKSFRLWCVKHLTVVYRKSSLDKLFKDYKKYKLLRATRARVLF
jgi:hypothetical protein